MKKEVVSMKKLFMVVGACLFAIAMTTGHAAAQGNSYWSIHAGSANGQSRVGLQWESAPLWSTQLLKHPLELSAELGVANWRHNRAVALGQNKSLYQLSAIPMVKWWLGSNWFLEGGIGATLISETQLGPKRYSTAFQFGDHVGVGFQIDARTRVGVRYSHFSNANIKKPNNGLDALQLTFARSY
jgi:lipid A 3-O-deacylase